VTDAAPAGETSSHRAVATAVAAARAALPAWSAAPPQQRISALHDFANALREDANGFAAAISAETRKPLWEARSEVDTMLAKIPISIESAAARRSEARLEMAGAVGHTRFKAIGVMAVLGPYNFPGHLPNGHIVPALLTGNTVVFKPSERTPGVGERLAELWHRGGLPPGVLNLVRGGRSVGAHLVSQSGLDGVLFTGSYAGGRALQRALCDRPEVLLALEMGGNNPLVVHEAADVEAAVLHTILSAYLTAGQRCTCARRLIVPLGAAGDRFVARLAEAIPRIEVGLPGDQPEPFCGPVISATVAQELLAAQAGLLERGGRALVTLRSDPRDAALLHPGLIDVSRVARAGEADDRELFGPLLQLVRVADFDAAIEEANRSAYGLSAALLSDHPRLYERFWRNVRAGVVNWNRQTTGASSRLPFGGLGRSGNHRPVGSYAVDACSDPIASLECAVLAAPETLPPGLAEVAGRR